MTITHDVGTCSCEDCVETRRVRDMEDLERQLPHPLAKACRDEFSYAVGLRDGTIIAFTSCEPQVGPDGRIEWLLLQEPSFPIGAGPSPKYDRFGFERGFCVRVADIMWCADAPYGS